MLKCVAIGLRIGVDDPAEMLPEVACRAKPAPLSHCLDREVTDFKEPLSVLDALAE